MFKIRVSPYAEPVMRTTTPPLMSFPGHRAAVVVAAFLFGLVAWICARFESVEEGYGSATSPMARPCGLSDAVDLASRSAAIQAAGSDASSNLLSKNPDRPTPARRPLLRAPGLLRGKTSFRISPAMWVWLRSYNPVDPCPALTPGFVRTIPNPTRRKLKWLRSYHGETSPPPSKFVRAILNCRFPDSLDPW